MQADPVLTELIDDEQYLIAADRYEEVSGDSTLAETMRIEGLEWQLIAGKPALKVCLMGGQELQCGSYLIGEVSRDGRPFPIEDTPILGILERYLTPTPALVNCLYRMYREAVARYCHM